MTIENIGSTRVLTPQFKQIDVMNANSFAEQLNEGMAGAKSIVLDLANVVFLDSSALGRIVLALRSCKLNGCHFVVCGATEAVELLFKMVRLSQIAPIEKDRETAIAKLEGSTP